jgi:hypothetical protein
MDGEEKNMENRDYSLDFYHLSPKENRLLIEQSPPTREWMDNTGSSYAYRCLPMTYANRSGWCVRLQSDVEVLWDGGHTPDSTTIICGREQNGFRMADNGTGNGIVTFHLNAIPRTSPEWSIWIMGAPNLVIPGASALSGVIESDWIFSAPTSNWKLTEPGKLVTFKAGDPVIFFTMVHRTEIENFVVTHKEMRDDPEMTRHFEEHCKWRAEKEKAGEGVFGKMYLRGKNPDGTIPEPSHHKTKLTLSCPRTPKDNADKI